MRKLNEKTSSEVVVNPVWTKGICTNHTGKMEGMVSVSSATSCNAFCKKMAENGGENCICKYCYARRQFSFQKTTRNKFEQATLDLTSRVLSFAELPVFEADVDVVRIEAFGELNNTVQAVNYINILRKNPHINFAWWTKRPNLIARAVKQMGIEFPDNCNVIYSNPYIDELPKIQKYSFINGYFTVWSSQQKALENGCNINCGSKKCKNCLNCYDYHDGIFFINELKKNR